MTGRADSTQRSPDILLPATAAIGGTLYFLTHCLRVILGSEAGLMEWLYDDAFYYLITAKHFSEQHISSFDGVTRTSGYHPLWMWLCAVVYGIRGQLDLTYVRSCMAVTFLIGSILLLLAVRNAVRQRRPGMLWALALAACSYSALNNGLTVMEWPLVVLFWCILHRLLIPPDPAQFERSGRVVVFTALLTGVAGSLSRTDFGLIPACYLASALWLGRRQRIWNPAIRSLAALLGATAGLLLVFAYNFAMTGSWMQGSVAAKHLAANVSAPFNPIPALWQFLRILLYLPAMDLQGPLKAVFIERGMVLLLGVLVLLAAVLVPQQKRIRAAIAASWPTHPAQEFSLVAALLAVAGYLFVYGFNTQATYGWYTATVTGFVLLLAARFFATLKPTLAAAVVFPIMLANICAAEWFGGNARAQSAVVSGAKALHQDHPSAIAGGGDVGKPSFYNHGTMFNLDGLMNNEVLPYLASGTIHCYVLHRHIEYLSNYGTVTMPIVNVVRAQQGKSPLPWEQYFVQAYIPSPTGPLPRLYTQTNFAAIRASGECPND